MAAESPDLWPRTGRDKLTALAADPAALADYLFNLEGLIAQFAGASPEEREVLAPTTFLQHVSFEQGADLSGVALAAGSGGLTAYANGYTLDNDPDAGTVIADGAAFPFDHDAVTPLPAGITHPSTTTYNLDAGTYFIDVRILGEEVVQQFIGPIVSVTVGGVRLPQGTLESITETIPAPSGRTAYVTLAGSCLAVVGVGGADLTIVNTSGANFTIYNLQDGDNHEVVCGITILKIA